MCGAGNLFLTLQIWTVLLGAVETLLGFSNGTERDKTPPTGQKEGNSPTAGSDSEKDPSADVVGRMPSMDDPQSSAVDAVKYDQEHGSQGNVIMKPDTSRQPGSSPDNKPKTKKRKKKRKKSKGKHEENPPVSVLGKVGKSTITVTATAVSEESEELESRMRKDRQTDEEQKGYQQALPVPDKSLSAGDFPIAVAGSEANGAVGTYAEHAFDYEDDQTDGTNFIVAAEDLVIGAMDPTDPRASLPVPQQNIISHDPNHERLSWTACYDDSCPIHLSEKVGTGYYPSAPREPSRHTRSR